MYCKSCGQQIEDNSRFCVHCGTLQRTPSHTSSNQQLISDKTVNKLEGVFGINFSKQIVGIFLIWFLFHLILLLINWDSSSTANDYFYPFSKRADIEDYDFSEFLLYTIVPLVVLIIINLFKQPSEIRKEALQSKYDLNYERDLTPTILGIFLFIFSLIIYFTNINTDVKGNAQLTDAVISIVSLVIRIGITIWVYTISNKLNRHTTVWGIFAFILPSIALIAIGLQRKLKRQT